MKKFVFRYHLSSDRHLYPDRIFIAKSIIEAREKAYQEGLLSICGHCGSERYIISGPHWEGEPLTVDGYLYGFFDAEDKLYKVEFFPGDLEDPDPHEVFVGVSKVLVETIGSYAKVLAEISGEVNVMFKEEDLDV